ncbi:Transmembrane protein [Hirschfeldia incana]|nr:Transmembrane protein [Hirschfeldia incana]
MEFSTLPILRQASDSSDKITSPDPYTMDPLLDLESGTNHKTAPGVWRVPANTDLCCIYRVPNCLRRVSPEAYTLQSVLIGPLHHSLKLQALKSRGHIANAKLMDYLNMEEHKKFYLAEFAKRLQGKKTIDGFKRVIKEDEDIIRASYLESTAWIQSPNFVEIILHDSVFILEFMLRSSPTRSEKTGDPLIDEPCLAQEINRDLILLENQIPFFLLEKLFDPIVSILREKTFHELTITHFDLLDKKGSNAKFKHFTDLFWCVRVETVPVHAFERCYMPMYQMYNADKLDGGGIKFEVVKDSSLSVLVTFDKGVLKIPNFLADDDAEITIRNIMALEQCHYPFNSHVSDYIMFLDFLIDTEKDVSLLVEKGIITDWLGNHGSVAKMVNKLCLGVLNNGSFYTEIANKVTSHYGNSCNKSRSILRRVYFSNLWRGTATLVAAFLLLLSLIQAVTSIIDVIKE